MIETALIIMVFTALELYQARYSKEHTELLSYDVTNILKGVFCILVVFGHIPNEYRNMLQDLIKCFGFTIITMYFMFSSYGLEVSVNSKKNYLDTFLKKRFGTLLIPYIISIIIKYVFSIDIGSGGTFFIHVLIVYYLAFYIIHKFVQGAGKRYILLILFCLAYSFLGFLFGEKFGIEKIGLAWYSESMGLLWGVVIAHNKDALQRFVEKDNLVKIILALGLSLMLGIAYVIKMKPVYFWGSFILKIFLAIVIITLALLVLNHIKIGNRVTKKLGKLSYEVFLYHGLIIGILMPVGEWFGSAIYLISVLTGTIVFSLIMQAVDRKVLQVLKS